MGREVISSPAEKEKAGNNPGLFCMAVVVYGLWGMGYGFRPASLRKNAGKTFLSDIFVSAHIHQYDHHRYALW